MTWIIKIKAFVIIRLMNHSLWNDEVIPKENMKIFPD